MRKNKQVYKTSAPADVAMWNVQSPMMIKRNKIGVRSPILSEQLQHNGIKVYIYSCEEDGGVHIWTLTMGEVSHILGIPFRAT